MPLPATTDCLNWIRAGWDPVAWPRAAWPVAPLRPAGWVLAAMPCEWPAVQRPLRRWGLRYPYLGPSPWPGMGVVVVV
jgi:hypothetical protein